MRLFRSRTSRSAKNNALVGPGPMFGSLKNLGFRPRHFVDVGANRGGWTRDVLKIFPDAHFTLFEPQKSLSPEHSDLAANRRVCIHYKGVGDEDGQAIFTEHSRDDSSSFVYSAEEARDQGLTQFEIEICRLDSALAESSFGPADVIKIDAEGYDLKVIDGAQHALSSAEIVLLEAAVACPTYPNTVARIFARMDELGFRLLDITDLNRGAGQGVLWLIEAAFVRKGAPIDLATQNIA